MVYIITGSKTNTSDLHTMSIDQLHTKRKKGEEEMRDGLLTKDQMNMLDCKDEDQEVKRVQQYDKWKDKKVKGVSNQDRMREWGNINREFKKRGEEGRTHSMEDIRSNEKIKYD